MSPPTGADAASILKPLSRAASVAAILVGCLVLIEWALDIMALKSVLPALVTIKANARRRLLPPALSQPSYPHAVEREDR